MRSIRRRSSLVLTWSASKRRSNILKPRAWSRPRGLWPCRANTTSQLRAQIDAHCKTCHETIDPGILTRVSNMQALVVGPDSRLGTLQLELGLLRARAAGQGVKIGRFTLFRVFEHLLDFVALYRTLPEASVNESVALRFCFADRTNRDKRYFYCTHFRGVL
jgi:hypothetical protein